MKIRSDYISNSSSCSFVINDIKSFGNALRKLSSDEYLNTWWMYGLKMNFTCADTPKNRKIFSGFIDSYSYSEVFSFHNNAKLYAHGYLENFIDIDESSYELMEDISIYAYNDDGNDNISKLTLLYWAMKSENVDVDNSDSEREFKLFNGIPDKIVNAALKMIK